MALLAIALGDLPKLTLCIASNRSRGAPVLRSGSGQNQAPLPPCCFTRVHRWQKSTRTGAAAVWGHSGWHRSRAHPSVVSAKRHVWGRWLCRVQFLHATTFTSGKVRSNHFRTWRFSGIAMTAPFPDFATTLHLFPIPSRTAPPTLVSQLPGRSGKIVNEEGG